MTEPTKSNETKPEGVPDPSTPKNLMGVGDPKELGPLGKATDPETGKPRCTAHSRTSGERCKQHPVPGTTVCVYHGGKAPQVRRKAALRLLQLVDPAITTLAREMVQGDKSGDRIRAAENVLDRTGYPRKSEVDIETAKMQLLFRLQQAREEDAQDPGTDEQPHTPASHGA